MRVAVLGLGYVGTVSAACLADGGHSVVGVDPDPVKVDLIATGQSPIVEPRVAELIGQHAADGNLVATSNAAAAVISTELALVCVGTPTGPDGNPDLSSVEKVSGDIGSALATIDHYYTVVIRSTVPPGTCRNVVIPAIEAHSGRRHGPDFGVVMHPEFLREASAVSDYHHPPKAVVGSDHDHPAELTLSLAPVGDDVPIVKTSYEVAETIKYVDNSWHALKVAFGNEIGRICGATGVDAHAVMDIFCLDTKLNISTRYLRPGMAYGGSCLPKDVRAVNELAASLDVSVPVLAGLTPSNTAQIDWALETILETGGKKIALLGLSFKAGTDDLREAPMVAIAARLLERSDLQLRFYDTNVDVDRLTGANASFVNRQLPSLADHLITDLTAAVEDADVIVIGNADRAFASIGALVADHQHVVDLVGVIDDPGSIANHRGLGW